jgi:hypothetical protein
VLNVQLDGPRKLAAPSVNHAKPEPSAASKAKPVSRAKLISIVKVKKKMPMVILQMKVQIQRLASTVRQAGRQKKAAQNVKPVSLGRTVMVVNHARKDTRGMEPITTLRSADNARRVKRRRRLVVLRVSDVILASMEAAKVFAKTA